MVGFPDDLVEKYGNKKESIGGGSFGKVWQTTEGYAVKVFIAEEDFISETNSSALVESGLMMGLKSAYLMQLLDIFFSQGRYFLVMPLGINLIQYFAPDEIQQIFYEVSRGVADMHANDVVHLDLKPQNCIDLGDRVVITDFGISTFQTCSKEIPLDVFTVFYRPLEVFFRGKINKYSDVWSLGVMLYGWIVGEPPFTGWREEDVLMKIIMTFGLPTEANWPGVTKLPGYDDLVRDKGVWLNQFTVSRSKRFFDRITDPLARDLLEKILVVNPARRLTIFEILQHPYVVGTEVESLRFDLNNPPGCMENLRRFSPDSPSFPRSIFPGKGYPDRLKFPPPEYFAPLPSTGRSSIMPKMFLELSDWMFGVCETFGLSILTYSQAMIMLIWVIRSMGIGAHKFQVVGASCLSIASDVYNDAKASVNDFIHYARDKFDEMELRGVRGIVLNRIGYSTVFTSPLSFVSFWAHDLHRDREEIELLREVARALHASHAILELSIEGLASLIFETFVSINRSGILPEQAREFIQRDYDISDEDEMQKIRERLLNY